MICCHGGEGSDSSLLFFFFFSPSFQMHKSYVFHSWRQVQNTYNPINYLQNRIQNQLTVQQKTLFFFFIWSNVGAQHAAQNICILKMGFTLQIKPDPKPTFLPLDFIPHTDSMNTIFSCEFIGTVLDCGTEQVKQVPSFYLVSRGKQVQFPYLSSPSIISS